MVDTVIKGQASDIKRTADDINLNPSEIKAKNTSKLYVYHMYQYKKL